MNVRYPTRFRESSWKNRCLRLFSSFPTDSCTNGTIRPKASIWNVRLTENTVSAVAVEPGAPAQDNWGGQGRCLMNWNRFRTEARWLRDETHDLLFQRQARFAAHDKPPVCAAPQLQGLRDGAEHSSSWRYSQGFSGTRRFTPGSQESTADSCTKTYFCSSHLPILCSTKNCWDREAAIARWWPCNTRQCNSCLMRFPCQGYTTRTKFIYGRNL